MIQAHARAAGLDVEIVGMKQKLGSLRARVRGADAAIVDLLVAAEVASLSTCAACGESGSWSDEWPAEPPWCDRHRVHRGSAQ